MVTQLQKGRSIPALKTDWDALEAHGLVKHDGHQNGWVLTLTGQTFGKREAAQ